MAIPRIIDNEHSSLVDVLRSAAKNHTHVAIASGYWDINSIALLGDAFEHLSSIRLLIGQEPSSLHGRELTPESGFPTLDFYSDLQSEDPKNEKLIAACRVRDWIRTGKLEVRIYKKTFLHAKCYVFGQVDEDQAIGIIGSSNFTGNGLQENTELNSVETDHRTVFYKPKSVSQDTGHLAWFESKWSDPETVIWNEEFLRIVSRSPLGEEVFTPYEMYIKTLHTIYADELFNLKELVPDSEGNRTFFDFQRKNINSLERKLNKYGVAMLADSVGLGKTTTAVGVALKYLQNNGGKKRVEIICPKSLVPQWEKELANFGVYNQTPVTLQNPGQIERRRELDEIASVSLFIIDESHNLRHSDGVRFQQILDWIRSNQGAKVLLVTATPINNNLQDIANQILLGAGGRGDVMKVTTIDSNNQAAYLNFNQVIENLTKKINQDFARTQIIDVDHIRSVMTPIIRTFVVRRTRQGIMSEYKYLNIQGIDTKFPDVVPVNLEYDFALSLIADQLYPNESSLPLDLIYKADPEELNNASKSLTHPLRMLKSISTRIYEEKEFAVMEYIFQLIMCLGFSPYRWRMYKSEYYGLTRDQIREMRLSSEESKKLLQQISLFGILRTVFLKRMESSVYSLRVSLKNYEQKLNVFENALKSGKIVAMSNLMKLVELIDADGLDDFVEYNADVIEFEFNSKNFKIDEILEDLNSDRLVISQLLRLLDRLIKSDAKLDVLNKKLQEIREIQPNAKVLIFSYYADTISYLQENANKLTALENANAGFVSSKDGSDSEKLANLFSPLSKQYKLKDGEKEIDFLFATDVLSEGQNLQDAGILINYDLHWNPVRMIQRNGRVNRIGSRFDSVQIMNMKPEKSLDSYLNLIRKLQNKIDLIKNTIGTDSPVLDEVQNPIEYGDLMSEIYSEELHTRIQAMNKAEKASDFLLAEDEFLQDLLEFDSNPSLTDEYKDEIYNISTGKFGLLPSSSRLSNDELLGLVRYDFENDTYDYQFVKTSTSLAKISAVPMLLALMRLRAKSTASEERKIIKPPDNSLQIRDFLEKHAQNYAETEIQGAPIGQETEILRLMWELQYSEEVIDKVRNAFKTNDVFALRKLRTLKRAVMKSRNSNSDWAQSLEQIVKLSLNQTKSNENVKQNLINTTVEHVYMETFN